MKTALLLIALFMTASCAMKPQQSHLLGSCMKLINPASIWRGYDNVYVGEFLLSQNMPHQLLKSSEVVGTINAGTKLELIEILKGGYGSYSPFLRGRVRVLDGEYLGLVADIPACAPYHPALKWVTNCTLDANSLTFNSELVEDCEIEKKN